MTETFSEDAFLNIPSSIISDILSRLPPKEAVQCFCVCKAWIMLLSDTEFINLHLSKSPTCLFVYNVSARPPVSPRFRFVEFEDETNNHALRPTAQMERQIRWSRPIIGLSMIGSINGLVCIDVLSNIVGNSIHVWNPIMGEFISIQRPERKQQCLHAVTYGFGISSGKYKLVMIIEGLDITNFEIINSNFEINTQRVSNSSCHVYTLGAGSWKNVGPAPYIHNCRRRPQEGLFLNGNIHWLVNDDNVPEQICCLNLDSELFLPFPPLPVLGRRVLVLLNLYQGCLCVCDNSPQFEIVIWAMKHYGKHNSWSKEVVISKHLNGHIRSYCDDIRIIKVFRDGEIMLILRDFTLLSYHPQRKTMQVLDVKETMTGPCNGLVPSFYAKEFFPSIVSLRNLGEVNINRM